MNVTGSLPITVTQFWVDANSSSFRDSRINNIKFSTHLDLELRYSPENVYADRYVTPIMYVIGFPGNVISFIVWLQPRMRHSSGYYLAALALGNLIFLVLHSMLELHSVWNVPTLDSPGLCEIFPVLYIATQFLSPLLVLSFAVERYISICHPLKRKQYCTTSRAKIVIAFLVTLSVCMSLIYGYFYHFNATDAECALREEVTRGGHINVFVIWNVCTEVVFFFPVLVGALVLNIFVIKQMRRFSRMEIQKYKGSTRGLPP
ncbi:neuromedin-U receptor 2-like [Gigantopelta aegis]|uniref:neuromedin-U receptor 2-like n=1 Tax=Gigantopelta aegis TaxID=1735272 RepID=UPI001B88808C|nr:neuromedin-U receptor 2-like [Gigantopelta aegis]